MTTHFARALIAPVAFGAALAGCSKDSTSPSGATHPVALQVAAAAAPATAAPSALTVETVRLVVNLAAFGSGDQFGCVDCQGGGTDAAGETATASLVTVPAGSGAVTVATEQVQPGRYQDVELELTAPTPDILATAPELKPDLSLEIKGQFSGSPFTLALPVHGTFREHLATPVDVPASGSTTPVSVTITLPVADWFTVNGTTLDPRDATQRAQIEAKIKGFFQAVEAASGPEN
jgi:hypothetical protein